MREGDIERGFRKDPPTASSGNLDGAAVANLADSQSEEPAVECSILNEDSISIDWRRESGPLSQAAQKEPGEEAIIFLVGRAPVTYEVTAGGEQSTITINEEFGIDRESGQVMVETTQLPEGMTSEDPVWIATRGTLSEAARTWPKARGYA
jgi:hypothetical protein